MEMLWSRCPIVQMVTFAGHGTSPMPQQSYPLVHSPLTVSCCLHSPAGSPPQCPNRAPQRRNRGVPPLATELASTSWSPQSAPTVPQGQSSPHCVPLAGLQLPPAQYAPRLRCPLSGLLTMPSSITGLK
jgi:hypothetical protein